MSAVWVWQHVKKGNAKKNAPKFYVWIIKFRGISIFVSIK